MIDKIFEELKLEMSVLGANSPKNIRSRKDVLILSHNNLHEIPINSILKLNKIRPIRILDLSHNKLNILPKEIEELKNLETFKISFNRLETLASCYLVVSNNKFSCFPIEIIEKTRLIYLSVSDEQNDTLVTDIKDELRTKGIERDPLRYSYYSITSALHWTPNDWEWLYD